MNVSSPFLSNNSMLWHTGFSLPWFLNTKERFFARTDRWQRLDSIRGRILIAFIAMSILAGCLGIYGALGIRRAGILVAKTFDQSLMSINYARAAEADFAAMQTIFARKRTTKDSQERIQLDASLAKLEQSLTEDLDIAAGRSHSDKAVRAAKKVQEAARNWVVQGRLIDVDLPPEVVWKRLDPFATTVSQQIDLLVNYTAGLAFADREAAVGAVALATWLDLVCTVAALLLSAIVAYLLAQQITKPLSAASRVAESIAAGDLSVSIPNAGPNELNALLTAMTKMRDNIQRMMEREVAQKRVAQIRLAEALESSSEGIIVVDSTQQVVLANSQARSFFGAQATKTITYADQLQMPTAEGLGTYLPPIISNDLQAGEICLNDGRWLRFSRNPTKDGGYIAVYSDITRSKTQEALLQASHLVLDAALDNMCQGLCLFDANRRLKLVNRRFCEIFALSPDLVTEGLPYHELLQLCIGTGNHGTKQVSDLLAEEASVDEDNVLFQELKGGRVIAVARRSMADGGWVATYEDVTERRKAEEKIAFMAHHDALTGLPNRTLFAEGIEFALGQVRRNQRKFAILVLDLDHFKQVNDTLGHPVGDQLLRSVAERLKSAVREIDMVSRLGGDEFAILQPELSRPEDAAQLAERIVRVLSAPFMVDRNRLTIGVSIGISIAPDDSLQYDKLLKNADVALYLAKADGRSTWRFFEADMDLRLQMRRILELDLRDAINRKEFDVYYQPLYDLESQRIKSFEALIRWHHPTRGLVSPMEFIPLAEEIGLIESIGEWVLQRACTDALQWPKDIKVAVNVSAVQFRQGRLMDVVTHALKMTGLDPKRLELEITESVLIFDERATLEILHKLRELGINISMDDFGTGYSSLGYLRRFPFDKIKIDQSFVRAQANDESSQAIVEAITALGSSLGIRTVAEGIETEEQLAWLRRVKCDEVQGFLFSPPVPVSQLERLISEWNGPRSLRA